MNPQAIRRTILYISFFMIPITMNYFSPVLVIMSSMEGIISASFVIWTALFITSLFIGRAFCSYICPYGGMQMTLDKASSKNLVQIKQLKSSRYILGIGWVCFIIYGIYRSGGLKTLNVLYNTEQFVSVDSVSGVIRYYMILGAALLFVMLMGRRSFCKYVCPMAILNTLGTRIKNFFKLPSLRMVVDSTKCIDCKRCDKTCPMSLQVSDMAKNSSLADDDCILCGECQATCKNGAIKRTFS